MNSWLPTQVGRSRTVSASRRRTGRAPRARTRATGARHSRSPSPASRSCASAWRRGRGHAARGALVSADARPAAAAAVAGVRRRPGRAPAARRADGGAVVAGSASSPAPRDRQATRRGSRSRAATSSIRSADPRRCARSSVTTRDTSRRRTRASRRNAWGAPRHPPCDASAHTPRRSHRDAHTLFVLVAFAALGVTRRVAGHRRQIRRQQRRRHRLATRRRLLVGAPVAERPAQRRLHVRRALLQPRPGEEPDRGRGQRAHRRRRRRRLQLGVDRRTARSAATTPASTTPPPPTAQAAAAGSPAGRPIYFSIDFDAYARAAGRASTRTWTASRRCIGRDARRRVRRLLRHPAAVRRRQDRVGLADLRVVGRPVGPARAAAPDPERRHHRRRRLRHRRGRGRRLRSVERAGVGDARQRRARRLT